MTEIPSGMEKSTSVTVFLNSVCPGLPFLDDNTHFSLENSVSSSRLKAIENFNWPLAGSNGSSAIKAHLDHNYLNVARPPFQQDVHKNIESTTYVPLPLHYTSLFSKLVTEGGDQKQDGGKHIGANVNPLSHDPFRLVHLNPGCLSSVITLQNHARSENKHSADLRNPFNKMTSSINKLLRFSVSDSSHAHYWHSLLSEVDTDGHNTVHIKNQSKRPPRDTSIVASLIDFDKKLYSSLISSPGTTQLLVSAHINVINVFAIDEDNRYACTTTINSTDPIFPQPPSLPSTQSSGASSSSIHSSSPSHKKVIERPILRLQLINNVIVTSMLTISNDMLVILGLSNGDIFILNLASLTFRHFDDLGTRITNGATPKLSSKNMVTSLSAVGHPTHDLLIVAGYATGEVVILDPSAAPKKSEGAYIKSVVGSDQFVTYFKRFDLSGWGKKESPTMDDESSPEYLIGHFKLSHKPITSIATTIPYESSFKNLHKPMIIAFASEDGLVRFIDLIGTYKKNFGNLDNFYNSPILTDIVSNYFQDGVRDIDFSPDNKFFVSCGKGDLVEIFKMSYYNVNALLQKKKGVNSNRGGRSRSGTINSSNSSNLQSSASYLGLGSTSTSFDLPRAESPETYYAPTIKDIAIVSRLKGHTNIVRKVSFVSEDQYFNSHNTLASGTYNIISCGNDGKVNIWEFNNKALPKIKKSHFTTNARRLSHHADSSSNAQLQSLSSRGKPNPTALNPTKSHRPTRSFNYSDDLQLHTSFSKLGINNLLSTNTQGAVTPENAEDQLQIVFSLYRSLYEMRLKKHYAKQKKELRLKYPCVIHGIVKDKDLPSIQVPLLTMDLSCLVKNGHISGYHCHSRDFWLYGKSGDVFRYELGV